MSDDLEMTTEEVELVIENEITEVAVSDEGSVLVEILTDTLEVVVSEELAVEVQIEQEGAQGPKGEPGVAGGSSIELRAGENLSSGLALIVRNDQAFRFDPNNASHLARVVGISTTSGNAGDDILVQVMGQVTDAAYNFDVEKPCFVAVNGSITTDVPATNILQPVGAAKNNKSFFINISTPIKR